MPRMLAARRCFELGDRREEHRRRAKHRRVDRAHELAGVAPEMAGQRGRPHRLLVLVMLHPWRCRARVPRGSARPAPGSASRMSTTIASARLLERRRTGWRAASPACSDADARASRAAIVVVVALEIDEAHVARARAMPVAIRLPQRRAREHGVAAARERSPRIFAASAVEPGPAIGVGQRRAGRHLRDVRRRMEIVGVEERPAERRRRAPRPTVDLPRPATRPSRTTIIGHSVLVRCAADAHRSASRCYRVIATRANRRQRVG